MGDAFRAAADRFDDADNPEDDDRENRENDQDRHYTMKHNAFDQHRRASDQLLTSLLSA